MFFNLKSPPLRRALFLLSAIVTPAVFSGCATVFRGTTETLVIQSEPSGASVRVSNGFTGVTPVSFTLSRKGDLVVGISKEGYEPVEVTVKSQFAGRGAVGLAGNVLIGGLIGVGVDAATGATLSHYPNPVKTALVPLKPVAPITPAITPVVAPVAAATEMPVAVIATTKSEDVSAEKTAATEKKPGET